MSVTLYLLNKKGFEVLKCICEDSDRLKLIDQVVASKDPGNAQDYFEEIKKLCSINSIPFLKRNDPFHNTSDYSIAIGWRWLIHDVQNLIVFHDSYLPKYRGFAPIVNMLVNGEEYLAATAIFASEGMDEGDIILQDRISIKYPIKISEAIDKVSQLYRNLAVALFNCLVKRKILKSKPQDPDNATYSIWRDEQDYFINWNDNAKNIVRFVDAVGFPYDGARTRTMTGDVIKVVECSIVENIKPEIPGPGKVLFIKDAPVILCGEGAVKLDKIEDIEGKPFVFKKFRTRLI